MSLRWELRAERTRIIKPDARPIVREFAAQDRRRAEEAWIDAWGELEDLKQSNQYD